MSNFTDSKSLDAEGLSLYDSLIKHYWTGINNYTFGDEEQIDELFPYEPNPLPNVSFSNATDEQLINIINGYYNGFYSLEDIKSIWTVGEVRSINLSAMSATNTGESHRSQTVDIRLIDFNYDTLTTPIGDKTKALITVELKNCLRDANVDDNNGKNNTENGYMNSTNTNIGGWTSCARRTWCNNEFYNALPTNIKEIVKSVEKTTYDYHSDEVFDITSDYIFLLSQEEIGAGWHTTNDPIGMKSYDYHDHVNDDESIFTRKQKLPRWTSYYDSSRYWLRTPDNEGTATDNRYFKIIDYYGNDTTMGASGIIGIAPAFCL